MKTAKAIVNRSTWEQVQQSTVVCDSCHKEMPLTPKPVFCSGCGSKLIYSK